MFFYFDELNSLILLNNYFEAEPSKKNENVSLVATLRPIRLFDPLL